MKINKIIFSITMACILAPAVAFAGVYFLVDDKNDDAHVATNKTKPCSITHPIRTCPDNKTLIEPCGLTGESASWFKKCECDTNLYNFNPDECRDNKSLIGKSCNNKYEGCDCSDVYKYFNTTVGQTTTSNCEFPKLAVEIAGCAKNSDPEKELYKNCSCPREYTLACNYPFEGKGQECENRYTECQCRGEFKRCTDGGKGSSCADGEGVKYLKCYYEFEQMSFTVVNGMAQNSGDSCDTQDSKAGIPFAEVTFRKGQEPMVFVKANNKGVVTTHIPYDIDDDQVSIKIEAEDFATIISTCPCKDKTYPLIPVRGGAAAADMTIVLTWDNSINDLDTHLVTGRGDNDPHLYFGNGKHNTPSVPKTRNNIRDGSGNIIATLDVDDQHCWGPETTNIYPGQLGKRPYYFGVQKWSSSGTNDMALSNSKAEVYVYTNYQLQKVYRITPSRTGTLWSVFSIGTDNVIRDINKIKFNNVDPSSNTSASTGVKKAIDMN